jgi:hypothetical protein
MQGLKPDLFLGLNRAAEGRALTLVAFFRNLF